MLVLGVGGDAVAGEEAGHYLRGPLFDLPPRPRVAVLGGGGLVAWFEAGGRLGEEFGEDRLEDDEPGLHGLGVGA